MMKALLSIFVILLLLPSRAGLGQTNPVADTLDWRGYYPLEIGNIWEWRTYSPNSWFGGDVTGVIHREIVSDTLIDGQEYFVQVAYTRNEFETDPTRNNVVLEREYVRYDSLRNVVAQFDVVQGVEISYTCDLSADFHTVAACYDTLDMRAGGGYVASDSARVAVGIDMASFSAVKRFTGLSGGYVYYHGIGRLPDFGEGTQIDFTHVKVGNQEFGTRAIQVGVEEEALVQESVLSIYPNPVRSQLYIEAPGDLRELEMEITDILGRSVPFAVDCQGKRCQLDASALSVGMYVLRYSDGGEVRGSRKFIVVQ